MMEINFTFKKKKYGLYKIVLRPFLRILAHSFDFPYDVRRNSQYEKIMLSIKKSCSQYKKNMLASLAIIKKKHNFNSKYLKM